MSAITIREESPSGQLLDTCFIACSGERIRVRHLLAERIRAHAARRKQSAEVPVSEAERLLRAEPEEPQRWEAELCRAIKAFENNGLFVMVDGRQILSLEEEIAVEPEAEVRLIRLVPLAGG